jgi:hypothetical protein
MSDVIERGGCVDDVVSRCMMRMQLHTMVKSGYRRRRVVWSLARWISRLSPTWLEEEERNFHSCSQSRSNGERIITSSAERRHDDDGGRGGAAVAAAAVIGGRVR